VRAGARHWKISILFAVIIGLMAWLLIPTGGMSKAQSSNQLTAKLKLIKQMGDEKAFSDLIEMALRNPDAELRRLAAVQLTESEGDGSTGAIVTLYNQTFDPEVKIMIIDTLSRISEIQPLTQIASSDSNAEYRLRALRRIKYLKANSESEDVRNFDVSALKAQLDQVSAEQQPPPPPPSPLNMVVTVKTTSAERNKQDQSIFDLMRELGKASIRRDASYFDLALTDDYVGTFASGETRNKAQEIAEATRGDRQISKIEFDEFSVSENGGNFVATLVGKIYSRIDGVEMISDTHYIVHLIKVNGELKIKGIDRVEK